MAYIYKIINIVNSKVYIGKTECKNPDTRWKVHKADFKKSHRKDRPLYRAMNKYGIDNFKFEVIEETNLPEEREIFFIKLHNSYVKFENSNGYNATLGGDGKKYVDEEKVINLYCESLNNSLSLVSSQLNLSVGTVSSILNRNGIVIRPNVSYVSKNVFQLDKVTGDVIQSFSSIKDAGRYCGHEDKSIHIQDVCHGKRKSAYGYRWSF